MAGDRRGIKKRGASDGGESLAFMDRSGGFALGYVKRPGGRGPIWFSMKRVNASCVPMDDNRQPTSRNQLRALVVCCKRSAGADFASKRGIVFFPIGVGFWGSFEQRASQQDKLDASDSLLYRCRKRLPSRGGD
jgi:hypothetical protein